MSGRTSSRASGRRTVVTDGRRRRPYRQRLRKQKAFDRGGPVWPPRSNVTNDRLGGGPPPAKNRGVWGAAPLSQNRKNLKKFREFIFLDLRFLNHKVDCISKINAHVEI